MITVPLAYSITHAIGLGFILYSLLKLFTGRSRDVHWLVYSMEFLFSLYFLFIE